MSARTHAHKLALLQKRYAQLWEQQSACEHKGAHLQRIYDDFLQHVPFRRRLQFTRFWKSIEAKLTWSSRGIKLDQLTDQELDALEVWSVYLV